MKQGLLPPAVFTQLATNSRNLTMRSLPSLFAQVLLLMLFASPAWANLGEDWLLGQARTDGSFATTTDSANVFQATAEVLETLDLVGRLNEPQAVAGLAFINTEAYHSAEYLSRKIVSNGLFGGDVSTWTTELVGMQGQSGGFGELTGYQPTPLDTAFALKAMNAGGASEQAIQRAIGYLVNAQDADGGWHSGVNVSSVYVTALVVNALTDYQRTYTAAAQAVGAAQRFLLAQRVGSGLWKDTLDSAAAVLALSASTSDLSIVASAAEALRALQHSDGSWEKDVLVTALAVRALYLYDARQSGNGDTGAVTGRVVKEGSGEPIAGAVVMTAAGNAAATTGKDGYFVLAGIPAGLQTIVANRDGYSGASKTIDVVQGQTQDGGLFVLAVASDSGVFRGRILESGSQTGVAGATVALKGGQTYNVPTDASGAFYIAGVAPGEYSLTVQKSGYYSVSGTATISAGVVTEFEQGLVSEGAYLDSTPGPISGWVQDAKTGAGLSGATFSLDNGQTAVTDAQGHFVLDSVARGSYEATLSADGYETRRYSIVFQAGAEGDLGTLQLYALTDLQAPSTLTLHGTVVDGTTGAPVSGASVDSGTGIQVTTDASGQFTLSDLTSLQNTLSISGTGYVSRQFTFTASGYGEAEGKFPLAPYSATQGDTSALSGTVADARSGTPIVGATVTAAGLTATTGSDGSYSLSGITPLEFTLNVSAVGYSQQSRQITTDSHGTYTVNLALDPVDLQGTTFQIVSFLPVSASAGADGTVAFQATVTNVSSDAASAVVGVEIFNDKGDSVATAQAYAPGTETLQGEFNFVPGESKTLIIPWSVAQQPPGTYRAVLHVVEPGTITRQLPSGVVLAEASTQASVTESDQFTGTLGFDPPLVQSGTTTPVTLSALILNSGNVKMGAQDYALTISDPDSGEILHTATVSGPEVPVGNHAMLSFGTWIPTTQGNLKVVVAAADGQNASRIDGQLYVGNKATGEFTVDRSIVAEGTQDVHANIAVRGVDITKASSADPLFFAVKEAVRKGGAYVSQMGVAWQKQHNCLGCHIQTQSVFGLASSFEKAPIDKEAAKLLYNSIASSQQSDGSLRTEHSYPGESQTMLGMWSLSAWPDKKRSFPVLLRAARFTDNLRHVLSDQKSMYWEPDDHEGWWDSWAGTAMKVVKGYVDLLNAAKTEDLSTLYEYHLSNALSLASGSSSDFTDDLEADASGALYTVTQAGRLLKIDPKSGRFETLASDMPVKAFGMAHAPSGEFYIAGYQKVVRRNTDGTYDTLITSSGYFTDVDLGADGTAYVADFSNNRILAIDPNGGVRTVASGGLLNQPHGLYIKDDTLYIANKGGRNLLKLSPGGDVSVAADGLAFQPMSLDSDNQGGFFVTTAPQSYRGTYTPSGITHVFADGTAEQILNSQGNGSFRGIAFTGGQVFVTSGGKNSLYPVVRTPWDTSLLPALKSQVEGAAHFYLLIYKDGANRSLLHAVRLIGLGEARKVITDPELKARVDEAMAYIADLLRKRQESDGGWARYHGDYLGSDPLLTALVGLALEYTAPSADDPVERKAIEYLLKQQRSDGSWLNHTGMFKTRLASTSLVMAYLPKALDRLGGIDVDLHVVVPDNVDLSNPTQLPAAKQTVAGETEHLWHLRGVTEATNIGFDMTLRDLALHESRPVASAAYMTFKNSFNDDVVRVDLDIPTVNVRADLGLALTTDREIYHANEDVRINADVVNASSTAGSGSVVLAIRPQGSTETVAQLDPVSVGPIDAGAIQKLVGQWPTGRTLAGDYEIVGRLYDTDGRLLDEATTPIRIVNVGPVLDTLIRTDRPVYQAWDSVALTARVSNTALNMNYPATLAEITVTDPAGHKVATFSDAVSTLMAEGYRDLSHNLPLVDAAGGTYRAELVVRDAFSHEIVSTAYASFAVERTPLQSLVGDVAATPSRVYQGDAAVCQETVRNRGAAALTGVGLTHQLVRVDTEEVLATAKRTVDLAGSASRSQLYSIPTGDLPLGEYLCVMTGQVVDSSAKLDADGFVVAEPPIRIDATMAGGERGRLLVLLDDGSQAAGNNRQDPHGPQGSDPATTQRTHLEQLLEANGWSYTIVTDADAFTKALRSGGYANYLLLAEHVKLPNTVQKELREAVYRGEGLVVAGNHDERQGILDSALGIEYVGKLDAGSVTFSGITEPGQALLAVERQVERIRLAGAQAMGRFGNGQIAVTESHFGEGQAVYAAFDWLTEATAEEGDVLDKFLLDALSEVHPETIALVAGGVLPVHLVLQNEGMATPGRLTLSLPAGVEVVDPGAASMVDGVLQLTFDLGEEQTQAFDFWVRLPAETDSVSLTGLIETGTPDDWKEYGPVEATWSLSAPITLEQVRKLLSDMPRDNRDKVLREMRRRLDAADSAMAEERYEDALRELAEAAEAVKEPAYADLHTALAESLWTVARRWWEVH